MRADPAGAVEHQCGDKQQHLDRAHAKNHIKRMVASGKSAGKHLAIYTCPHCGYFHIGRRPRSF